VDCAGIGLHRILSVPVLDIGPGHLVARPSQGLGLARRTKSRRRRTLEHMAAEELPANGEEMKAEL